jgi:Xaa-Pro aminopeptidase
MLDSPNDRIAPFPTSEYETRLAKLQQVMAKADLDAAVFTSEDNYRYLTGFYSPTWINLTRPRFCIVPRAGDPVIIIPANNDIIAEQTSWVRDVRTWVSPNPVDDGVTMLVDAIRACLGKSNRIGLELGPESRLTMPVGDFLRVREMLKSVEILDGFRLLHGLRMVKSPGEIARMRRVAQIASRSFEALDSNLKVGDSEKDASVKLRLELVARGADTTPYVSGGSGRNGYTSINTALRDRVMAPFDILTIDTGSTVDGYFCDFNRGWAIGEPSDEVTRAYDKVWRATEAGLAVTRPGATTTDVWRAMAKVLAAEDGMSTGEGLRLGMGRFGHGCGLRMCEPPSLNEKDGTVLKPGMVITLEPGLAFTAKEAAGESRNKVMVHEENVVITEDGCDLLTTRAPRKLPVVS